MLDIPSISAIVAAIGVLVGIVFALLQLRDLVKTRQTDLVIRLYSTVTSKEFLEAYEKTLAREYRDYDDYGKKYGWSDYMEVAVFLEELGVLLHRKLIDIGLVDDLFSTPIKMSWEKMKPVVEDRRKRLNRPQWLEWSEYLYNEMQKREEKLAKTQ